jgi:hypothetical protein
VRMHDLLRDVEEPLRGDIVHRARQGAEGDRDALSELVRAIQTRCTGWRCGSSAIPTTPRTHARRS